MFCPECGSEIEGEVQFCPDCGSDIAPGDGTSSTEGTAGDGGITSKIPGMRPGSTIRNLVLASVYVVLILAVIGAAAGPTDTGDTATTNAGSVDDTNAGGGDATATEASASGYAVKIEYSGEWSGALSVTSSGGSSSESISGVGSQTIEIDGSPDIISANAQKRDGGSGTITVKIIEDGEVVSEASSSSEYGVAQTSKSFY